jgi:RNA polymerase sigma factor (sigma-70 family)
MTDPFPTIDLDCLTPRQREVIEMHYCHCLTFGQIAAALSITKSSAQKHHDRALGKLRG